MGQIHVMSVLTSRSFPRERASSTCVRSAMLHVSETWPQPYLICIALWVSSVFREKLILWSISNRYQNVAVIDTTLIWHSLLWCCIFFIWLDIKVTTMNSSKTWISISYQWGSNNGIHSKDLFHCNIWHRNKHLVGFLSSMVLNSKRVTEQYVV